MRMYRYWIDYVGNGYWGVYVSSPESMTETVQYQSTSIDACHQWAFGQAEPGDMVDGCGAAKCLMGLVETGYAI